MSLTKLYRKFWRFFCEKMTALCDHPLGEETQREKELVEELRSFFQEKITNSSEDCPESEKDWLGNQQRLRELVLNDDPRNFLRWDVIIKTMSVVYSRYISMELKGLKQNSKWDSVWRDAIEESAAGHPTPYWRHSSSSENLIHHAYHMCHFEDKTGKKVSDYKYVVEFGGGYGSFCRLSHKLGFQGKYIIFDFEAFSHLQRFYLSCLGFDARIGFDSQDDSQIFCISGMDQFKQTISQINLDEALFVATWSISETPLDFRSEIFPFLSGFNSYLIGYQPRFKEVDNDVFFSKWQDSLNDVEWVESRVEILKRHHQYLFGMKKSK